MANKDNKRILSNGQSARMGERRAVWETPRGGGFTRSGPAQRELIAALREAKAAGEASEQELALLEALEKKHLT